MLEILNKILHYKYQLQITISVLVFQPTAVKFCEYIGNLFSMIIWVTTKCFQPKSLLIAALFTNKESTLWQELTDSNLFCVRVFLILIFIIFASVQFD